MSRSNENIRIAKNTLVVYARLIITAIIGLVTSRYVLQILGASDFGLYSVIGGIIALFTFISGSLQATSVRFINFEMGKPHGDLNEIFSTSRQIHIFFSLIIGSVC
jgi:O-antigen/teichoic acid export membrane protein